MTRVAISGYFDPIHVGHIDYIKRAQEYGDLIVIVNNDEQAKIKKGKSFMNEMDRLNILQSIVRNTDEVILSVDEDETVCKTLEMVKPDIFAKGGDRFASEIPEADVCKRLKIRMIDGLGDKIRSSSDIIRGKIYK